MNIILLFFLLSVINVIFSTIKSIITIKGGKFSASLISAGYYAFYNIVLIYSVADFGIIEKCIITFGTNLVGVFLVKLFEEKIRKDQLWKIETTILSERQETIIKILEKTKIPYNYIENVGKYTIFNIYCKTQKESKTIKDILNYFGAKYFASETKIL